MASNKTPPKKLSIPQIADIHTSNPSTGKALEVIADYINKTVTPPQGNRIAKRVPRTTQL
jgi:hypothetical protein